MQLLFAKILGGIFLSFLPQVLKRNEQFLAATVKLNNLFFFFLNDCVLINIYIYSIYI